MVSPQEKECVRIQDFQSPEVQHTLKRCKKLVSIVTQATKQQNEFKETTNAKL